MRFPKKLILILFALILISQNLSASSFVAEDTTQAKSKKAKKKKEWDVTAPISETKELEFTTTEGTWMNLDVSPDGREIVFDLLGDIYIMPITGGIPEVLLSGPAFEVQPRFSPDGSKISYTSDKGGGDNIWVMNRDGSAAHAISDEDFRLANNACWTPDGNYLIAKKHFTSRRSLGAGEIWMYHISGGKGLQLTKRKNDQQDVGEPCVSPDGRYVYFSEDMSSGGFFQYNKDPNSGIYWIRRVDRATGEVKNIIRGSGGAVRPQISPDGKILSFIRRVRLKTVLYLHDLETGEEWPIYDDLYKDQQETWAVFGVYPNYAWTPDGKNMVIWAKGTFREINIDTQSATPIPFEADVKLTLNSRPHFKQEVSPAEFEAKMLRHVTTSPDGRWLVFNAAGHLWKKRLPDGEPKRLTNDPHFEFQPSFSVDGNWIVYTTWSDAELGSINKINIGGGGKKKLTTQKGYYFSPSFSQDGRKIVFRRGTGNSVLGFTHSTEPGLYWMSVNGGEANFIGENGRQPRFSKDGKRVYFMAGGGEKKSYKSVRLDGGDERTHFTSKYATQIVPSPDEQWVAFTELFNAYIAPFPVAGQKVDLSSKTKAFPVKKVTRDAGWYLHWSGDSQKLHWSIGPEYFSRDLKESFDFVAGAADSLPAPDTSGLKIGLTLKTDVPSGKVALVGARLITMNGDEVIEAGTIVVDGNRITAVGNSDEVAIPGGAKQIDVSGKTIMPGIVDVHAHLGRSGKISPQQHWHYFANLAFGVTTTHDPSNDTEMVFAHSEMMQSGAIVAPRVYSTGMILYGAEGDFKAVINSLDDARSHLRRLKAVGAFSVKSYNQPRRSQRQQIMKAAHELEMMVYPEGGSFFFHNMSMLLDGHTGIEHSIPISPLYNDVLTLWGATETGYTPTLVVSYGGIWGENYWYQNTHVWENERLLNFVPRPIVDGRARRRKLIPDDDFGHIENARAVKAVLDAGGKIQLGAHGQMQGLGAHWEMWMFEQGGMTELEAIRAATLDGAYYIGMDDDLGSLTEGKLADLIVMNRNPLENIRNSEDILYVMINGRLFDAMTMNEIGNHPRKRARFYWENPKTTDAFVWRGESFGFNEIQCGCFVTQ